MQLGLVYLGLILLIGACYLFMRYSLKQMNTKIIGILELTNTLAQEMEEINKVSNFLGRTKDEDSVDLTRNIMKVSSLQPISDDDSDDDSDEDQDDSDNDEDDDEDDGVKQEVRELAIEEIVVEDKLSDEIVNESINELVMEENIDSLIIEGMIDEKNDVDKMTVSELKLKIKEKDPSIKLTNLKRNDLLNILKNEHSYRNVQI